MIIFDMNSFPKHVGNALQTQPYLSLQHVKYQMYSLSNAQRNVNLTEVMYILSLWPTLEA